MEEVPRLPMLSVDVKYSAASTDFGPKISQYISKAYEENPNDYSNEIADLNALREGACKANADFVGCNLLKKYYAQLNLLKNRFPMESDGEACVTFSWFEKYSDLSNATSVDDIRYEMACVLHNIGALHSYLGALDSRMDAEGMKISCTHFQRAAYAFHHLNDSPGVSGFCCDFDPVILNWNTNLMMAQAQECILEKSIKDHRNPNIIAKIAIQVSIVYKKCLDLLDDASLSDIVEESKSRLWKKFIKIKQKHYTAVAYLHSGIPRDSLDINQVVAAENIGERLAYLQAAKDCLNEANKLSSKESQQLKQPLQALQSITDQLLTTAKKENDFIYHEKVPALGDLPEIKGVTLVKLIPFDPLDPEISGSDIFARLVPISVHQAASLYSEEKANLSRQISEKIQAKNQQLDEYLTSLQLEDVHLTSNDTHDRNTLPEKLLECCAAFNAVPDAVPDLLSAMNKLSTLYRKVEGILLNFDRQLDDAENELTKCEAIAPHDQNVSSAKTRLNDLRKDYQTFMDANKCATENNTELHEALVAHSDNLKILSLPLSEVKKRLPSSSVAEGPEQTELKRLLDKVEEMKQQRNLLMDELRHHLTNDDITKFLLANRDTNNSEIFAKQISKHDEFLKIINLNLSAQENILEALTEANAKYAPVRKCLVDAVKKRNLFMDRLFDSYNVYLNLKEKSKQGISFYDNLQCSLDQFNEKMVSYAHFFNDIEEKISWTQKPIKPAIQISAQRDSDGPKLKDYLANYQRRKAANVAPGQFQLPPAQHMPTNGLPPLHPSAPGPSIHLGSGGHSSWAGASTVGFPLNPTTTFAPQAAVTVPYSSTAPIQPQPFSQPYARGARVIGGFASHPAPVGYTNFVPPPQHQGPPMVPMGFGAPMAGTGAFTQQQSYGAANFALYRPNVMDQPIPVPLPPPMAPSAVKNIAELNP